MCAAPPTRPSAPPTKTRVRAGLLVAEKPLQRAAHEVDLPADRAAAVADREVKAQPQALAERQRAVLPLGEEARRLLARKHHFLNQLISRHSRNAIRAR